VRAHFDPTTSVRSRCCAITASITFPQHTHFCAG
jgi:hypothetical protein